MLASPRVTLTWKQLMKSNSFQRIKDIQIVEKWFAVEGKCNFNIYFCNLNKMLNPIWKTFSLVQIPEWPLSVTVSP